MSLDYKVQTFTELEVKYSKIMITTTISRYVVKPSNTYKLKEQAQTQQNAKNVEFQNIFKFMDVIV